MGKVKVGADLQLDMVTIHWLMKDASHRKERERELEYEAIIEIPLEKAIRLPVDIFSVVDEDIDEYDLWDYDTVNAEQYLVSGKVLEVCGTVFYKQGFGGTLEGKRIQKQDEWMEYID